MLLTWLRYLVLPLALTVSVVAASRGMTFGMAEPLLVSVLAAVSLAMAWLAERLLPFSKVRSEPFEVRADWLFFGLTAVVDSVVVGVFERFRPESGDSAAGPFAVVAALVVWELGAYVAHRLGHGLPLLWRFHALHHAPKRMTVLNNFRLHPLDLVLKDVLALSAVAALGFDAHTLMLVAIIKNCVVAFQHSDADLRHGWLNYVFSTNSAHRWHHSVEPVEGNTNYGTVLLLWDAVFGTLRLPSKQAGPARLGLYDNEGYATHQVIRALLSPFCWQRCTRPSSGVTAESVQAPGHRR